MTPSKKIKLRKEIHRAFLLGVNKQLIMMIVEGFIDKHYTEHGHTDTTMEIVSEALLFANKVLK